MYQSLKEMNLAVFLYTSMCHLLSVLQKRGGPSPVAKANVDARPEYVDRYVFASAAHLVVAVEAIQIYPAEYSKRMNSLRLSRNLASPARRPFSGSR